MEATQWQRAKAIFAEAAELQASQRSAYLAQQCLGDDALRADIEQMLAADRQDSPLLDEPVLFWSTPVPPEVTPRHLVEATISEGRDGLPFAYVGEYQLLSPLGQGGMGEVYAAWDEKMGRKVALKLMKAGLSEKYLKRFDEECRLLARLNHPNIVTIFDRGQIHDRPYFVMEYLDGQPLSERLRQGPLEPTEWLKITQQICAALSAAHSQQVIHRDLKPDNLFLAQNVDALLVKVLDFGVAAWLESETITQTLEVVGTSAYISPEQALGKGRREIDCRADIYLLGAVVYEMMTGERVFTAHQSAAYLHLHANVIPPKPSQRNPAISPALDAVVMKALAKKPAARFDSARAFAEALQTALEKPSVTSTSSISYDTQVRPVATNYLAPETQPIPKTPAKWPYAAAALAVLALALSGWLVWRQFAPAPPATVVVKPNIPSAQPTLAVAATPLTAAVPVDILNLERFRRGAGKVPLTDTVRTGDHIYFQLTPPHAGWLSLVQSGSDGAVNVVYVHPRPVPPARAMRLQEMAFDLIEGEEKLYFIFTKAPDDLTPAGLSGVRQRGKSFASGQATPLLAQLDALAAQPALSATVVVRKVVLQHQR